jgi:hypothetical protein
MLVGIFLFGVYFCFFTWLSYKPNRKGESHSKKLSQQEVIEIVTATPKGQAENKPVLTVEVNLGNSVKNKVTNGQQFPLPASRPASEENGTKISLDEYAENASTTLPASAQTLNSVHSASEGGLAIALRSNIATNFSNEETRQNLHVEEVPGTAQEELMYDKKIINEAVDKSRLAVGKKIKNLLQLKVISLELMSLCMTC